MKLTDIKAGDAVITDDGFTCMPSKRTKVREDDIGLYVPCRSGKHYLDGQLDGRGHLIGISKPSN